MAHCPLGLRVVVRGKALDRNGAAQDAIAKTPCPQAAVNARPHKDHGVLRGAEGAVLQQWAAGGGPVFSDGCWPNWNARGDRHRRCTANGWCWCCLRWCGTAAATGWCWCCLLHRQRLMLLALVLRRGLLLAFSDYWVQMA